MSSWNDMMVRVAQMEGQADTYKAQRFDTLRRESLQGLNQYTGRNVIAYYSGWLQKPGMQSTYKYHVCDADIQGLMATIYKMDRSKGLDLILHTPGGEIGATQAIVAYLKTMFDNDIRAIVPQLAMSAGTMIACSCKEIIMGKHSSIGPVDPQVSGVAAHGIIEEYNWIKLELRRDKNLAPLLQTIISKYPPTLLGECEKAIKLSNELVTHWLADNMLKHLGDRAKSRARAVSKHLGSHVKTLQHDRHINSDMARDMGLTIVQLEEDHNLQDHVLTVHHAFLITLGSTKAFKIIQNHDGNAFLQNVP